ncbi:class I histocompatibility antigen, Gogo-A*0201 alpha chain-like [Scyliorhinus canicula]|uniref:class I histocompatibility antigen, Gogo-A*0201 alpha chain-like n=1 Tax=Scyliorhinus canicula TaxID=7830 RepID=UPI0018F4FDD0|nr:class I histocompatibility antigen, Gogo-A*0201 alpha chain-like [Scyliorhinus canicula]
MLGKMSSFIHCFTKWILLMVALVLTHSEDEVFQTPAVLRAFKGESATFTSPYWSHHSQVESMFVSWWRDMRKEPVCGLHYMNKTFTPRPGCDGRMTVTLQLNSVVTNFTIQDLQLNDTDHYYYIIQFSVPPPTKSIHGNKTSLIVEAPPEVDVEFLAWPENGCCIQLVCRAVNFYPANVQLRWNKEGKEGSVWIQSAITITSNNSNLSTCYVNLSQWENGDVYACHVNHSTLQTPLVRNLTIAFDEPHEDSVYIWVVVASVCVILVTGVVYLLIKCSRKENPKVNEIYVNVGTGSRNQETASTRRDANQNLDRYQGTASTRQNANRNLGQNQGAASTRQHANRNLGQNQGAASTRQHTNRNLGQNQGTASKCQNSSRNLNRNSNSNYSFIRHIPSVIYENTLSPK